MSRSNCSSLSRWWQRSTGRPYAFEVLETAARSGGVRRGAFRHPPRFALQEKSSGSLVTFVQRELLDRQGPFVTSRLGVRLATIPPRVRAKRNKGYSSCTSSSVVSSTPWPSSPAAIPCGFDAARHHQTTMLGKSTSPVWKLFLGVRCTLYLLPWLAHLLLADIALSALLPVSVFFPNACYNISSYIAESVWRGIQLIFTRINRAEITVSGAEKLPKNESAIVISNHVEWTDFYMIQELALRSGMLGRCRWFAKAELKYVPFLGWGLWAMNMPLVSRKWTSDQREIDRVFRGVIDRKWPICE